MLSAPAGLVGWDGFGLMRLSVRRQAKIGGNAGIWAVVEYGDTYGLTLRLKCI